MNSAYKCNYSSSFIIISIHCAVDTSFVTILIYSECFHSLLAGKQERTGRKASLSSSGLFILAVMDRLTVSVCLCWFDLFRECVSVFCCVFVCKCKCVCVFFRVFVSKVYVDVCVCVKCSSVMRAIGSNQNSKTGSLPDADSVCFKAITRRCSGVRKGLLHSLLISSESSRRPQRGCCAGSPGRPTPGSRTNTRACLSTDAGSSTGLHSDTQSLQSRRKLLAF